MNKMIYLFLLFVAVACTQEVDTEYGEESRIYFEYQFLDNKGNVINTIDSVVFSFGLIPDDREFDTAKLVVRYTGWASEQPRTYKVKVMEEGQFKQGKTTMEAGKDYDAVAEEQTFRGNALTDTLRIVVHRTYLNKSFSNRENKVLMLSLESGGDFGLGVREACEMKLLVNDYLVEPSWWSVPNNISWGIPSEYHPAKWKLLISYDERFSNPNSLEVPLFEVRRLCNIAAASFVPVADEDMGVMVYWDRFEPLNK